jgi:glucoamylase
MKYEEQQHQPDWSFLMRLTRTKTSLAAAALVLFGATAQPGFAAPPLTGPALGGPGFASVWGSSAKSMLGTSATPTSLVYFTGHKGIVSEVFYPTVDKVNTVDLQFLVGGMKIPNDSSTSFVDEEKLQAYTVTRPNMKALKYQAVTHTDNADGHDWKITKIIFTDPARNTLVQRVTFSALNGKNVSNFQLYALHNPAMNNSGAGDTSKTIDYLGRKMLVASQGLVASALAISLPWKISDGTSMVSNGFVGVNDGWTDLLTGGNAADKVMNMAHDSATNGNVAQMGWVDFGGSQATSISFDMVLGFGDTETNAMNAAFGTLGINAVSTAETNYTNEWNTYANGLSDQNGTAAGDSQYYLAAMSLKAIQDKTNGAMVAGLGNPWGDSKPDGNTDNLGTTGGYHLIWPRDLFKFANALITAGDTATANKALDYMFTKQMQTTNCGTVEFDPPTWCGVFSRTGRFPQNTWVDGSAYFRATQKDETAMPIILAARLNRWDLWPKIKMAADFLADHPKGAWTQQERFEENGGYSPSTIAAEIAGLVSAAKMARNAGEPLSEKKYLKMADRWQRGVSSWTVAASGAHSLSPYYLRISEDTDPNSGTSITIGNGGGSRPKTDIVDGGFLELVRMGVKNPKDLEISNTITVYDKVLGQNLGFSNGVLSKDAWFRYNFDGYGEKNNGENFPQKGDAGFVNGDEQLGRGRLWPIFTAERGMFEIAKASGVGSGAKGAPYLTVLKKMSSPEGMIPEQVWNITIQDTPNVNRATSTPPVNNNSNAPTSFKPGTPTKSMSPLSWAMGEYINLVASMATDKIVDMPPEVCSRYSNCVLTPRSGQWGISFTASTTNAPTFVGQGVYVTGDSPELGMWDRDLAIPVNTFLGQYPVWKNRVNFYISPHSNTSKTVQYKYFYKNEFDKHFFENLPNNGNRSFTMGAPLQFGNVNTRDLPVDTISSWQTTPVN